MTLCIQADFEVFQAKFGDPADTKLAKAIAAAEGLIAGAVPGLVVGETPALAATLDGRLENVRWLPEWPVVSIEGLTELTETLTAGSHYLWSPAGKLHRLGTVWSQGPDAIVVEYTAGFGGTLAVPETLKAICLNIAWAIFQAAAGQAAAGGPGAPVQESIDSYSVTYDATARDATVPWVLGPGSRQQLREFRGRYRPTPTTAALT